jgi:hypothetical protein
MDMATELRQNTSNYFFSFSGDENNHLICGGHSNGAFYGKIEFYFHVSNALKKTTINEIFCLCNGISIPAVLHVLNSR